MICDLEHITCPTLKRSVKSLTVQQMLSMVNSEMYSCGNNYGVFIVNLMQLPEKKIAIRADWTKHKNI